MAVGSTEPVTNMITRDLHWAVGGGCVVVRVVVVKDVQCLGLTILPLSYGD
jgi:hypothetical protein